MSDRRGGRLEGRGAFITGAARGQGRAHAMRMANEGADIIAVDIADKLPDGVVYPPATAEDLSETVRLVEATNHRILAFTVDTRDYDALREAVDDGVAQLGRLDIIVANAGIAIPQAWNDITPESFRDVLDINVTGTWNTVMAGADKIIEGDRELLVEAKSIMPKLLLAPFDVLVVDQLGKEFSGGGMDPHTTGRTVTTFVQAGQPPTRLVVLDVTERSHGNCCGVGNADITTRRLFNKMDQEYTYTNVLTSTVTNSGRVGLIMDSDKLAIQAALKTCNVIDQSKVRMARIANTLHITEMFVSESMLDEARKHENIEILNDAEPWVFDENGDLTDIGVWHQRD